MNHHDLWAKYSLTWMLFRNFACGLQRGDGKLHRRACWREDKPAQASPCGLLYNQKPPQWHWWSNWHMEMPPNLTVIIHKQRLVACHEDKPLSLPTALPPGPFWCSSLDDGIAHCSGRASLGRLQQQEETPTSQIRMPIYACVHMALRQALGWP